jgi:hypothetical protein
VQSILYNLDQDPEGYWIAYDLKLQLGWADAEVMISVWDSGCGSSCGGSCRSYINIKWNSMCAHEFSSRSRDVSLSINGSWNE